LDPTLPFNAFAMPGFADLSSDVSYVDIESNHFLCECDKMGWLIAAAKFDFDSGDILMENFSKFSMQANLN
jgi:hypothetical protein